MLADCDQCELRDIACADCVITALPDGQAGLGDAEWRALRVLADAGLLPPLRFAAEDQAEPPSLALAADHTRNDRTRFPRRHCIETVKTRPSVGEPVETALALH
ncbi:MAG TPA: hypothetical protein VGL63_04885 [Streptosporangiaceae bacterium]|jgi:hypothetical protein